MRLETNPQRILDKLNIPDDAIQTRSAMEQLTRQIEADRQLDQTLQQAAETKQKSAQLIKRTNSELSKTQAELARLKPSLENLRAQEQIAIRAVLSAEEYLKKKQAEFQAFDEWSKNIKAELAKELQIENLSLLELQIRRNDQMEKENANLMTAKTTLKAEVESIPRQLE